MILAEKLVVLRKAQGFSQEDLADKLDVSRQAVYKWEVGQATPDIGKLKILSSLYNVSLDNLLNDNEGIVYQDAPKSSYGAVVVKKELDVEAADKDNTKLFPDEQKKFRIRKIVLGIFSGIFWLSLASLIVAFIWGTITMEDACFTVCAISIFIFPAAAILKGILGKIIFPKVQLARTYFKQEKERAEKELTEQYATVIQLQNDLLAWFVYDAKTNSFGFYFDGEMQFFCPMTNFARLTVENPNVGSLYGLDVRYFDETGNVKKYMLPLSCFRSFWQNKRQMEDERFILETTTKAIISEIKQRLDIEKDRI